MVTDKKGKRASLIQLTAWDVCHYTDLPTAHFLYPEHVRASAAIGHGKFAAHPRYAGGSGIVIVTVTAAFVGAKHQLSGALHMRRTGPPDGNAFVATPAGCCSAPPRCAATVTRVTPNMLRA